MNRMLPPEQKTAIRVLLLPKFGDLTDESASEAGLYYHAYCRGGSEWDIAGNKLYCKDGVAICLTGMGKANAAITLTAILSDQRFDFSSAYLISIGCSGAASGYAVMGDVCLATAVADFDLGHSVDRRELRNPDSPTSWFRDASFDDCAYYLLNSDLTNKVYALTKDIPLETTEKTIRYMAKTYQNAAWATRAPKVLKGTAVTSDNYWKGLLGHANAVYIVKTYGCPDPYVVSEMEDTALANTAARFGMLDRFLILRAAVNMDTFMDGATPEQLWSSEASVVSLSSENSEEALDIFKPALRNHFRVGSKIIQAILDGTL